MLKKAPETAPHHPYDIEIEQALIGALLVNNRLIDQAAADLEPAHFYDPLHARIFEMIVYMAGEGGVTPVVLHGIMKHDPGLIEMGGTKYLAELAGASPSSPSIREHILALKELAMRRALVEIGEEIVAAAHEGPADRPARKIADVATERLLVVGTETAKPNITPYQSAMDTVRELEQIAIGKPIPVVKTGFWKLDDEIGGLRGGDLFTILGKSGQGKSALMGAMALNAARRGHPVIFFSLEMTLKQLTDRLVCDIDFTSNPDKPLWYSRVRNGALRDGEFERYMLAARELEGLPLEIIDKDSIDIGQMSARARAFKAKHSGGKLGLVLSDYAQIVDPTDAKENRERQVARIARGHKALAKRLEWPVGMGSQMNESDENRAVAERRPRANDARESKAIMNESDFMFAPWRPVVAVLNRKPVGLSEGHHEMDAWWAEVRMVAHRFEFLCLKNRHGRLFDLEFWAEMGASAIRCGAPAITVVEQAQADLLEGR